MLEDKDSTAYAEFERKVRVSFNASTVESKRREDYDKNGEKFEGIVDGMDRQTGYGRIEYRNGESYEGRWWLGEYDGLGRKEYANGDWYDGEWKEGKMHGEGTFNLAARDWSKTPRKQWSTGKDWTFEGVFENNTARNGKFNDGDGETRLNVGNPIRMSSFWIQAKLCKDDEKVTVTEREDILLPDAVYPAQHHVKQRKKLKDLNPLTQAQYDELRKKSEKTQSLLRQLHLLT